MARKFFVLSFLLSLMAAAAVAQVSRAASEYAPDALAWRNAVGEPETLTAHSALLQTSLWSTGETGAASTDSAYDSLALLVEPTLVDASRTARQQRETAREIRVYTNADIQRVEQQTGLNWPRPFAVRGPFSAGFTYATAIRPDEISSDPALLGPNSEVAPNTEPEEGSVPDLSTPVAVAPQEEATDPAQNTNESVSPEPSRNAR